MDDTTPQDLDDGPVDLDLVADRLEAALATIAQKLDASQPGGGPGGGPEGEPGGGHAPPNPAAADLAARLDGLIGRLRDALARGADPANGGAGG